jgi:hypothetical protein
MTGRPPATPAPRATQAPPPNAAWPVRTSEHIDLWLHGYAMLTSEAGRVPVFRRGYRAEMTATRSAAGVMSSLDANLERLQARLTTNPALMNAQFAAMHFLSWDDMQHYVDLFLREEGDPRRTTDARVQQAMAVLAGYFPSLGDRDWLRLFMAVLQDERAKYFGQYWIEQSQARARAVAAVDSLWGHEYYTRFRRFLTGTRQTAGDIVLSMVLGGEGRTLPPPRTDVGERRTIVAVPYPASPDHATDAIFVFAHEVTATLAGQVVDDNTSPAERRSGVREANLNALLVRAGAMLLQRIAPELADGYALYYLRQAGAPASGSAPQAALAAAFPLPDAIRDAFLRQLEIVLGGI